MDAGRASTGHDRLSGEERWAEYAANVGQKPKALRAVGNDPAALARERKASGERMQQEAQTAKRVRER